jgi:hypothetical protein
MSDQMNPITLQRLVSGLLLLAVLTACNTATPPPTTPPAAPPPNTTATLTASPTDSPTAPPATPTLTQAPTLTPTTPPATATPAANWVRQQFATVWDIEYPEDWTTNEAGLHEGNLGLSGAYEGHDYSVGFSYPIFDNPDAMQSLEAWIEYELAALTPDQRSAVQILDITVAGAPAKKILNMPERTVENGVVSHDSERLYHVCYIWRRNETNPSVIRIVQTNTQPFDAAQAETLLDRFLAGVQ